MNSVTRSWLQESRSGSEGLASHLSPLVRFVAPATSEPPRRCSFFPATQVHLCSPASMKIGTVLGRKATGHCKPVCASKVRCKLVGGFR